MGSATADVINAALMSSPPIIRMFAPSLDRNQSGFGKRASGWTVNGVREPVHRQHLAGSI
jgi:hypothetical protein